MIITIPGADNFPNAFELLKKWEAQQIDTLSA
jgi:hypothetical protein